jgi:hypothetical protein
MGIRGEGGGEELAIREGEQGGAYVDRLSLGFKPRNGLRSVGEEQKHQMITSSQG